MSITRPFPEPPTEDLLERRTPLDHRLARHHQSRVVRVERDQRLDILLCQGSFVGVVEGADFFIDGHERTSFGVGLAFLPRACANRSVSANVTRPAPRKRPRVALPPMSPGEVRTDRVDRLVHHEIFVLKGEGLRLRGKRQEVLTGEPKS